jgi:4-azaleucine resistance transporter AzlC
MGLENRKIIENGKRREIRENSFLQGVIDCVPTLLGYWSIGFAAGVVQKTAGLSIAEIALTSSVLYAGSAQFIMAGMIAAGTSGLSIVVTIFFVNLRHLLLSAALSPYFKHLAPLKNMLVGALLTDETFGVAIHEAAKRKQLSESWMHGLNLTAYLNWLTANLAGAYLGQWISEPERFGLDFALTGMFIGLLVLALCSRKNVRLDLIAAATAVAVVLILGWFGASGSMTIIAATVIASTVGMVISKWK